VLNCMVTAEEPVENRVDLAASRHDNRPSMTNDEVHTTLFGRRWKRCSLRLDNGDVITVDHPDYLFMPPDRNWVLWVKPEGKGIQFVPTSHITAIELEEPAARSSPAS